MDEALRDFHRNNRVSDGSRGKNSWPSSGPRKKVEDWQTHIDSFTLLFMRYYFRRFTNHRFPPADPGDLSRNPQAEEFKKQFSNGWAEWWKRAFSSPEEKTRLIREFETRARELDDVSRGGDIPPPDDGEDDDTPPPRGDEPPGDSPPPPRGDDGSSRCFIASAVYGENSWQVNVLREFRDRQLMANWAGRFFTKIYYASSPPVARFLHHFPGLKRLARLVVDAVIKLIS
jgi:hypothetical protein